MMFLREGAPFPGTPDQAIRMANPRPLPASITRRDFVNGIAVGVGGALLAQVAPGCARESRAPAGLESLGPDWYGYGGVGDYRLSHGNTPDVVTVAHRIRDGDFDRLPDRFATTESYDLVIVGGGMAGLGAALEFSKKRKPGQTCLLLDNHPIFGGEAKENEFDVDGTRLIGPQGANGFFIPPAESDWTEAAGDPRYYAELGIPRDLSYPDWQAGREPLGIGNDNYEYLVPSLHDNTSVGHFFETADSPQGVWAVDMFQRALENTPLSEQSRRTLLGWYRTGAARRFANDDEARRVLDTMSYRQYLERELGMGPEAADYADLFLASACGLGSDAVSAYLAYNLPMPGLIDPLPRDLVRQSFPGGNSGFARYFLKAVVPEAIAGRPVFEDIILGRIDFAALDRPGQPVRVRLDATAVHVAHDDVRESAGGVTVVYHRDGGLHVARAKAVVMATGGWVTRHVVRDLSEEHRAAYARFVHAPFLVANVALTNWRFLYDLGITAAIWKKGDSDFGYTCNIRRPMHVGAYQPPFDPDQPIILSFYTPFYYPGLPTEQQVKLGRAELLGTSYAEYERRILNQMRKLFGSAGFDAERDVAGIILNRWGHAYSVPFPGFFGGADGEAPRDVIRRPHGRIAFGHSELQGWQHWGPAADEGRRAVNQVLDAL